MNRYSRFDQAICQLRGHGKHDDRNWRSALWILTAKPELWEQAIGTINWRNAEIAPIARWGHLCYEDRILVKLAIHLCDSENDGPRIASVASALDSAMFRVAWEAMQIYRGLDPARIYKDEPVAGGVA